MSVSGHGSVATASSTGFLPLVPLVAVFPHRRLVCNGIDVVMIPAGISREEILVFASPYPCNTSRSLSLPPSPLYLLLLHFRSLVNLVLSLFLTDHRAI